MADIYAEAAESIVSADPGWRPALSDAQLDALAAVCGVTRS